MNIYDWLEQVRMLDELIAAKQAEREDLMELATSVVPALSGMPHGNRTSDRVGNAVVRLISAVEEIDILINRYMDHRQKVIEVLEKLPPNEYGVLHRQYVRYMTLNEIAEDMDKSVSQVKRYKNDGIKKIQKFLKMALNDTVACDKM